MRKYISMDLFSLSVKKKILKCNNQWYELCNKENSGSRHMKKNLSLLKDKK